MGKIILKLEHIEELEKIVVSTLKAHRRAHWDEPEVIKVVTKVIIKRFKRLFNIANWILVYFAGHGDRELAAGLPPTIDRYDYRLSEYFLNYLIEDYQN